MNELEPLLPDPRHPHAEIFLSPIKSGWLDLSGLSLREAEKPARAGSAPTGIGDVLPCSYRRFAIRARNGVAYLVCRHFSAVRKKQQVERLRQIKLELEQETITLIASEMVECLGCFAGGNALDLDVTSVACGHSRRPDCLAFRLASEIATRMGARRVHTFSPRPVRGSSHPKEFRRLPPLQLQDHPSRGVLVIDDIATSGFHIHEALTAVRSRGHPAIGLVWISGAKEDGSESFVAARA